MKAILLTGLCLCSFCIGAYSQTFAEWWRQKKTRIKYLQKQVAELEALKATVEEGHIEAETGVDSIGTVAAEEWKAHKQFLQSLRVVKPVIKDTPELVTCYALVATLAAYMNEWGAAVSRQSSPDAIEAGWISDDLIALITYMRNNLQELEQLITDESLEMADDQRYQRIAMIEIEIRRAYIEGVGLLRSVGELKKSIYN